MKSQGRIRQQSQPKGANNSFHFSLRSPSSEHPSKFDAFVDFTPGSIDSHHGSHLPENSPYPDAQSLPLLSFHKGSEWQIRAFYQPCLQPNFAADSRKAFDKLLANKRAQSSVDKAIMCPRPSSNYCHLCKETFSDYLKHVRHTVHQSKMAQDLRKKFLDSLVSNFKENRLRKISRLVRPDPGTPSLIPCKFRLVEQQSTLTPVRLAAKLVQDNQQDSSKAGEKSVAPNNILLIS